jgi:glycosyltransferase involved in cell wall biosynthesis
MVIQSFSPVLGGAERQVEQLAPLLDERGVDVAVVTRAAPGAPARERRPGLDVRRVPCWRGGAGASVSYTARGTRATVALRPDVIHAHDMLSPSTIALLAGWWLRVPIVVKPLSAGPHGDLARLRTKPFGDRRLALLVSRVAAFACVSDEVECELEACGVPAERRVRVANGVDAERFRPAAPGDPERRAWRERFGVGDGDVLALYCGRFTASKGVDTLVAALREAPVHLLLAGEGEERERLTASAAAAGVGSRLHVLDTISDTAPAYRAADVYVTASRQDGLSNSVLEAMASGLPVVGAPAGGMVELLGGGAAVLLRGHDPVEMAAALARIADDEGERRRLGERARERVMERFSLTATADALAGLYERLVGEG